MPNPAPSCTVRLLTLAAQSAYRVKNDNLIDSSYSEEYSKGLIAIGEHGYAITDSIAPIGSKGTGTSPLAATCLMPNDSQGPIVIAFRGTKTMGDVGSDIKLGIGGVVGAPFRDAAFAFYQKVREENPGRSIVLTGHSLGGHLAQYVATKAYNTDPQLRSNPLVQVRTFNTAPVSTKHSVVFKNNKTLLAQFVNYRLSPDVVSDLPLGTYYGNTFVFPCSKRWYSSHTMGAVIKHLPVDVLNQTIGTKDSSKNHNLLIELTNGLFHSYQSQVKGQFFSRFRAGAKNVAAMQEALPIIIEHIKNGRYGQAVDALEALEKKMNGSMSKNVIHILRKSTDEVRERDLMHQASQSVSKEVQYDMKARVAQDRKTAENTERLAKEAMAVSEVKQEKSETDKVTEVSDNDNEGSEQRSRSPSC
jgi:hypothetical protein